MWNIPSVVSGWVFHEPFRIGSYLSITLCLFMCTCSYASRYFSPLCHEEVAPAQWPRWLQLGGQRLPQSQPLCGGDWRWAAGRTGRTDNEHRRWTLPLSSCQYSGCAPPSLPLMDSFLLFVFVGREEGRKRWPWWHREQSAAASWSDSPLGHPVDEGVQSWGHSPE